MIRRPWIQCASGRSSCAANSRSHIHLTSDFFSEEALRNLTQHLLPGLWPFIAAAIGCAVAMPLAVVLSRRFGVLAQPGGRHAHSNVTPLLGGLAMWIGFAAA